MPLTQLVTHTLRARCRYFIAFVFWLTYTWHAAASFAVGRPLWHAAAGSLAFGGAWLHAAVMWRRRRRLAAEAAADKDE